MALFIVKYWLVFIGLILTLCGHSPQQSLSRPEKLISILCYHHIDFFKPTIYSCSLQSFDQQIKTLTNAGFSFVSLADIENYYYHNKPLPDKSIAITFDDANKSVYTKAYPYLKKKNIPFAVFVYPTIVNHKYSCTWQELQEMSNSGVIIGSHSYWHPLLTNPKKSDGVSSPKGYLDWLHLQTMESKRIITAHLGVQVKYFSIPFGAADTTVLAAIKKAGYTLNLNVTGGTNGAQSEPLNLNRIIVLNNTSPQKILELVSTYPLYVTTSPNNMERVYSDSLTLNISIKNPERFIGPWTIEMTYKPTLLVTPNQTGAIALPITLTKQGFYTTTLTTRDKKGLVYKATWLFIYTKKKPDFLL